MGILALISSVLEILKEFLRWQTALAQINARKIAFDIDQQMLAQGRDLRTKIDSARNAGDLAALSLYLDDQANAALYAARVRSALPDLPGSNLGVSIGVSAGPASDSRPDHSAQPVASTKPSQPLASTAPIGKILNGIQITHYGYPGDSSPDSNSMRGIGDRGNHLTPNLSVAMTKSARGMIFGVEPHSTGKTFSLGGFTFQDDDSAPEENARVDVYDPYYAGVDKGCTPAMQAKSRAEMVAAGILTA